MDILSDANAFIKISDLIEGNIDQSEFRCHPGSPSERLRNAFTSGNLTHSALDIAILVRHVLRVEDLRHQNKISASLHIPNGSPLCKSELWKNLGMNQRQVPSGLAISARPWCPTWIPGAEVQPVDESTSASEFRRDFNEDGLPDDPFLQSFGYSKYRSVAQRAGVRAALLTPPGDTLVVDLPTSDGKSTIFRAVDAFGFASDSESKFGRSGTTLVVVPTVTLALDHEASCQIDDQHHPLAYIGGASNQEKNKLIRERIIEGTQGLCFAAPESAVTSLRWPLALAAKNGKLRSIVIDEAHLVDAWGIGFRTEFQELSGLQRQLIDVSPTDSKPRTLLLSATLSPSARETLANLFGTNGQFKIFSAPQIRPEPEFWIAPTCIEESREERVYEAIHHIPRPAILYVTKVVEAEHYYKKLREIGFTRLGLITGNTNSDSRAQVLNKWREESIDLIVATSAFGLGVDYQHVRTILHACVPESLDRFYQEVGRGGRDGKTCLSLMLPAKNDFIIAKSLANRITISIERGMQRWSSMFNHPDRISFPSNKHKIRLDVPPGYSLDDIDMLSGKNTDWNARTLVLMAQSSLIRFCGESEEHTNHQSTSEEEFENSTEEQKKIFQTIEILDQTHLDLNTWKEIVRPIREWIFKSGQTNFELLKKFCSDTYCPSELFSELYGQESIDKACGGCTLCRRDPNQRGKTDMRREPGNPWSPGPELRPSFLELFDSGRLLVFYDTTTDARRLENTMKEIFLRLVQLGLRRFGLINVSSIGKKAINSLDTKPVFVGRGATPFDCRLPVGPHALIYGENSKIGITAFEPRVPREERLFIVPHNTPSPHRSDLLLYDSWPVKKMLLPKFMGEIGL
jgi:ATP-dependent DNA helicase RecQ